MSCGNRSSTTAKNAESRSVEQVQREKELEQAKLIQATQTLGELEQQRGDYEECTKQLAELEYLYRKAPDKKSKALIDRSRMMRKVGANLVEPVTQVYGLIPELRREESLSEGFLHRYESKAEKPDSSSAEANDLCQQFFKAGDEAGKLNTDSKELSCTSKNYSDAIEQLHPVLVEANNKMKQVLALSLECHLK